MSFPRYPKYKDSGVEWLGEVPAHWAMKRLKHVCRVFPSNVDKKSHEGQAPVSLCNYTDVYYNETITADMVLMSATASPEQIEKFTLRAGDTIVTKDSETADDIAVAAYVPGDLPGVVCGYHLSVIRPTSAAYGAFVKRFFDSNYAKSRFAVLANGLTRVGLGQYELDNIELAIPPFQEQLAIAAFLDREMAKIDALVAEQQRLVELLKEKRQAIISHIVTKGLDPDASMKQTGIEWLGDVPAHWNVTRLGNLFREAVEPGNKNLPILSVSIHHGVSDKEMAEEEMDRKVIRSEDRSKYIRVLPGDLVYNMMRAWQGGFGAVTVEGMVSPAYVVARPRISLETAYIESLLRTPKAVEQMRRHSKGVTDFRLRLYWDEFKNIKIALPSPEEAKAICKKIREMDEEFAKVAHVANSVIEVLQERRATLISDAVTGRFDVRTTPQVKAA